MTFKALVYTVAVIGLFVPVVCIVLAKVLDASDTANKWVHWHILHKLPEKMVEYLYFNWLWICVGIVASVVWGPSIGISVGVIGKATFFWNSYFKLKA